MSRSALLVKARIAAYAAAPTAALTLHDNTLGPLTAIVDGRSMCPTFNSSGGHDRVILNRMYNGLERGDVVVLRSPSDSKRGLLIKRVIGLEGDSVESGTGAPLTVPADTVWVEGDNKPFSLDSRHFGPVDKDLVEARVALKVWPLSEMCLVDRGVAAAAAAVPRLRRRTTEVLVSAATSLA